MIEKLRIGSWLILLFQTAFIAGPLTSQELSLGFSGYAKNLTIRSNSILTNNAFLLNVSRLRAKSILDFGSRNHTEIWLDTEVLAGDFLNTLEFELSEEAERPTFVDLDWNLTKGNNYQARQSLFRAFTTFYFGNAELTFGRQRIAWGTGFAWNPTDLFNPFNPADIELEEKRGVDAAYLAIPFGSLSRLEAAFAPGRKDLKASAAVRLGSNLGSYDFSIMAGEFQKDRVLGGDFAGYIGGGGFRGEFAYTWKEKDSNFFRAILNADYSFPHDFYAFIEFYFNGQGTTNKKDYPLFIDDLLSGRIFNLAKHYFAASVIKSVTPLLGLNIYSIFNLNDRSSLVGPAMTYSLATNLEIAASVYFLNGANDSEFGFQQTSYFAFLQYYF